MANLQKIYDQDGLTGILPYAFDKQGYQFLTEKLKQGEPLYLISFNFDQMPFISLDEKGRIHFSLYTNPEQANMKCDELARNKYYTSPIQFHPKGYADKTYKRWRDLGISHICVDDAVWVDIRDLAPAATYDGILNTQTPLRNAKLNAAYYYMLQEMDAESLTARFQAYFWDVINDSYICVPMKPMKKLKPGETLAIEDCDYHYYIYEDGTRALMVFTDYDFWSVCANAMKISKEDSTIVCTPKFPDLRKYMEENPNTPIVINAGVGDILLTLESMKDLDVNSLNEQAKRKVGGGT